MGTFVITAICPTCARKESNPFEGGFIGEQTVTLECLACSHPWIRWPCHVCGGMNYGQVECYPAGPTYTGICLECGLVTENAEWGYSSREQAEVARGGGNPLDARARLRARA